MKIVLIGYMGSGKSSIGRRLSEVVGNDFIDLDVEIETSEGTSISEIFQKKGEIYFRKKEAQVLQEVIAREQPAIIASGGGTPCYGRVMDDLLENPNVITVYLKCSVDTLTERLFPEREHRPVIAHLQTEELLNDFIRKHLFERSFYYSRASHIITCDGIDEKEVVEKILFALF
ncbi:shikimate kinase [Aureisphaera galaxeae]|uniref:shikimate kinase n=1 Tax=Aureisphaera galaxeae TaxID=1538023 RepID=UPI002350E199|nr:shikimate kinase [Aureisphaera galaxeae]MDC8006387.1 shikimate kinase [Aureisphaera galaxeae]